MGGLFGQILILWIFLAEYIFPGLKSLCRKAWRSVKCILIGYFTASDQASNFSFFLYFLNSKNFRDKKAFRIWSEGQK